MDGHARSQFLPCQFQAGTFAKRHIQVTPVISARKLPGCPMLPTNVPPERTALEQLTHKLWNILSDMKGLAERLTKRALGITKTSPGASKLLKPKEGLAGRALGN